MGAANLFPPSSHALSIPAYIPIFPPSPSLPLGPSGPILLLRSSLHLLPRLEGPITSLVCVSSVSAGSHADF